MKLAFVVLALAATAWAACPNSCSGHGRCNAFDKCECFKQAGTTWGTRIMYTGADCSMRTCPLASAFADISTLDYAVSSSAIALDPQRKFDGTEHGASSTSQLNVDSTDYKLSDTYAFNVRVLSTPAALDTFILAQWKLGSQAVYSPVFQIPVSTTGESDVELGGVDGAGVDTTNEGIGSTGVRVYASAVTSVQENNLYTFTVEHREGRPYQSGVSNSAHQDIECSGRGLCDRGTGRCTCFNGYEGEACQRTSCPNKCSGHGTCQSLTRFVKDTGVVTYNPLASGGAYDGTKEFGCLCDAGYRGSDCSLIECPSGVDPLGGGGGNSLDGNVLLSDATDCSGRGVCDYATGTCSCFKGYFGTRCESSTNLV